MAIICMSFLEANELIFTKRGGLCANDVQKGIHTGGFSIKNILMEGGISPIHTLNIEKSGSDKVSDLFVGLVVPNWTYTPYSCNNTNDNDDSNSDTDSDDESQQDEIVPDMLMSNLLKLSRAEMKKREEVANKFKKSKRRLTKASKKYSRKQKK
jgi:hypothetical protein